MGLSTWIPKQFRFKRFSKAINVVCITVLSFLLMPTASAGRPPGKPRIYLGNFNAPALITLPGGIDDQVTIDAELFSPDPDENGEGEPLILFSFPGLNSGTGKYYVKERFTFKLSKVGQTLAANINGADYDESATLSGWVDPAPPKPIYTDAQKEAFTAAGDRLDVLAAGEDFAARRCVALKSPPIYCEILEAASLANTVIANTDHALALDPPAPDYTIIDAPIIPSLPLFALAPGMTQAEVDTFNALLSNQEKAIGYSRATLTAINKSVGAYDANDDFWEAKQRQVAAEYMLQLSILTRDQVTLLSNWVAAWKKGSNGSITITPSDVYSAEIDLINFGLPPSSVQTLQQLGADAATIETIKNQFTVQDVYAVAGTFPDLLTDISLINALNRSADAFLAAALNNAVPLAPHQQVKGEGIVADNAADATFEFGARVNGSGKLTSEVHLQAHSATYNFRITTGSITHAALLGNVAVLDGTYSASDATSGTFRIIATDAKGDEGKGKDTVDISFSNGFHLSGVVNKGEIQIRTEVED
jgi:hypothetical protein